MRILVAGIAALVLAACVPVPVKVWDKANHAPKVGDVVRAESRKGERYIFHVYKTDEKGFYGIAEDDQRKYRVPYAALKKLEVRATQTSWMEIPLVSEAAAGAVATEIMGRILLSDFP